MGPRSKKAVDKQSEGMRHFEVRCLRTVDTLIEANPDITIGLVGGETLNIKDIEVPLTSPEIFTPCDQNGNIEGDNNNSSNNNNRGSRLIKKSRPLRPRPSRPPSRSSEDSATSKRNNTRYAKNTTDSVQFNPKPGTIGSRQALKAPPRRNPNNRKASNLPVRDVQVEPIPEKFDTNNMVDSTIINFLPEIGQRAHLEDLPSKPEDLCLKFEIVIVDLDLRASETPPHADNDEKLSSWKALASPAPPKFD